ARMVVELPGGRKVLFGGHGAATGLSEVGIGDEIAKATGDRFRDALGSLAELVKVLEQSVGSMAHRPDKVEMEFGASLSGECDLWIVSGEGEAEFKVKLSWEKEK
ncbi:CU044_2847 family protein, partial [Bradyrhizobium oligotrophicum]